MWIAFVNCSHVSEDVARLLLVRFLDTDCDLGKASTISLPAPILSSASKARARNQPVLANSRLID